MFRKTISYFSDIRVEKYYEPIDVLKFEIKKCFHMKNHWYFLQKTPKIKLLLSMLVWNDVRRHL